MLTVTATDLPRLMACNGSRLMGGEIPPVNTDDTVRNEGTAAHWVVEQVNSGKFSLEELIDRKAPNGVYITVEMIEFLADYLTDVIGKQSNIEVDTSHGRGDWTVSGRADLIQYDCATAILTVGDLKYGWSIVEPVHNWTLISHAIGIMQRNPTMQVATVIFKIYQPRPYHPAGHVRTWVISATELAGLARQIDATLSDPTDELRTGEHCNHCPALAFCPAARKAQMNAIEATEKAFNDEIDNVNLSFQLDHLKRAIDVLEQLRKSYCELAMFRLKSGQAIDNYAIESELSNRGWFDYVTPEIAKVMTGIDLSKVDMITPAQAKKKGVPDAVIDAMTERRQKGFKLARIDAHAKATKMFKGEK